MCSSLVVEIVINGWDAFREYGDWLRVIGGIVHNSMDHLPFFLLLCAASAVLLLRDNYSLTHLLTYSVCCGV